MTKKLNILFLCSWYPSRVMPSNGDFIQRHAQAISLLHNISVLHIVSDKNCSKNIEIVSTKEHNVDVYIGYIKDTKNIPLKCFLFWRAFFILLRKVGSYDLIHLNKLYPLGIFALYLKILKRVPYIISEHWTGYLNPQSKKITFLEKIISKKITKKSTYICPVSTNLGNSMRYLGLKGSYIPIPNIVNTKLFTPKKSSKIPFTIIHVSNMNDAHKNISGMLKVAKKLETEIPNFEWNFIGRKDDDFSTLIKQLQFKTATINFIAHIPQKELVAHLQRAAIFVLFSNYENLPCVILESFSCGVPVISTNVGGINEYFPKDFGLLIKRGSQKELLEAIKNRYQKQKATPTPKKMHLYATKYFGKQKIASLFSEVYNNTLQQRP